MDNYLALRQQLKQSIRAQMQRDSGSATDSIGGDSHNNYGCFFGPSETVFAGKAVKEISNLYSKFKIEIDFKKNYATAKPTVDAAAMREKKVQHLKESRDYSFLSSSFEGEICSTTPPKNRDSKRGLILKEPTKLIVKGGFEMTKKPTKSMEKGGMRDQKSNSSRAKKESRSVSKQGTKKSTVSSVSKQQPEQKKKKKEGEGQERRPVEKRERGEDNVAINLIREMFGYDPTTFSDDEKEELKMEASFADIQKEERRSAKIATREDREELRKLETECRKKRKFIN